MEPVEPVQTNIYQSNTCRRLKLATFQRWAKGSREAAKKDQQSSISFLWLIQQFQVAIRSSSPDMTTVFHAWPYGRFIGLQSNLRRKKLHKTNQGSNFLRGSFRRESQPQHLKRRFFLKNRPTHFHINRTIVIKPVKQKQLSFLSNEMNKSLFTPVHSVS